MQAGHAAAAIRAVQAPLFRGAGELHSMALNEPVLCDEVKGSHCGVAVWGAGGAHARARAQVDAAAQVCTVQL